MFAIVSDGDLMEGIAAEAASLAGQLGLGRMVYLYDDNDISLDGPTELSFDTEDVGQALRGLPLARADRRRRQRPRRALEVAIDKAMREEERPSLIRVKSIIGWPSPNKQGTSKAHGSPLGEDEVRATKEVLGWDPDQHFLVPDDVYEHFDQRARGGALQGEWEQRFRAWRDGHDELAARVGRRVGRPAAARRARGAAQASTGGRTSSRRAPPARRRWPRSRTTCRRWSAARPTSASRRRPSSPAATSALHAGRPRAQRLLRRARARHGRRRSTAWPRHGGIVRPYGSTFLQFADYMRGAIRLSALTGLAVAWVYTHDSVGLGEDGPTHQPVEHLAALRAIPGLVGHPAGRRERDRGGVADDPRGPRRAGGARPLAPGPPDPAPTRDVEGVARGAYVLRGDEDPQVVIVGTGSELSVAIGAAEQLTADGIRARVVSMPSWELFAAQDDAYRDVGAAARPAEGLRRGRRLAGLGALGGPRGVDRPLRRLRPRRPRSSSGSGSRQRRTPRRPPASCSAR